jgi:hypothetical protein
MNVIIKAGSGTPTDTRRVILPGNEQVNTVDTLISDQLKIFQSHTKKKEMNFCVTKKNSFKIVQMSNETIQK